VPYLIIQIKNNFIRTTYEILNAYLVFSEFNILFLDETQVLINIKAQMKSRWFSIPIRAGKRFLSDNGS